MSQHWTTSDHLADFDQPVDLRKIPCRVSSKDDKDDLRAQLDEHVERIADLQAVLHAHDQHALLLVFQGMDASGKDGTVRKVLSGVNPAGCRVTSFKAPNTRELEHDYLWRVSAELPGRGKIGVFNRSHYEDVLVVRVHPELLGNQRLRSRHMLDDIWSSRSRAIREWERHLADSGVVILKFFLHISKDEQYERLLERIDDPENRWKGDPRDVVERSFWEQYRVAYEYAIEQTSRPWAPWYVIPADSKSYARTAVADIVRRTLERLDLKWPVLDEAAQAKLDASRAALLADR